jgi:hypothetical protein
VGALVIPRAHNRTAKGGIQDAKNALHKCARLNLKDKQASHEAKKHLPTTAKKIAKPTQESIQTSHKRGGENDEGISIRKYSGLPAPFLNRDILKLPIKVSGQIPLHVKIEIISCNEMNDKISHIDIDMNVYDNARNVIERISSYGFPGPDN